MMWDTSDPLVGQHVTIQTAYSEDEKAVVLAVSTKSTMIRVRSLENDEILIGNQWED